MGKIFVLAFILDGVYQLWVMRWFYPGEALIVALLLAIIPHVVLRGPVNGLVAGRDRSRMATQASELVAEGKTGL